MDKIYHNKNMTNSRESSFKTQSQIHGSTRPLHNPQSTEERSAREKKKPITRTKNRKSNQTDIRHLEQKMGGSAGEGGVI